MKKQFFVGSLILGIFIWNSCADQIVSECDTEKPKNTSVKVSFSDIQEKVFTPRCAVSGCHVGANAPQGLDLSAGQAYNHLVNVSSTEVPTLKRVSPGNSRDSYIIIKLEGTDSRMKGARMPVNSTPLSQSVIDSIKTWIDNGALNN